MALHLVDDSPVDKKALASALTSAGALGDCVLMASILACGLHIEDLRIARGRKRVQVRTFRTPCEIRSGVCPVGDYNLEYMYQRHGIALP